MVGTDVRVAVLSEFDFLQRPYRIDLLSGLGYRFHQVREPRSRLAIKVRDVIDHRTGYPVSRTARSIASLRTADLALALFEKEALAFLRLRRKMAGRVFPPVVVIVCWLADELERMPAERARARAAQYADADLMVVFSANQVDVLAGYGIDPKRVAVIPFGIAADVFPKRDSWREPDGQVRVMTAGVDRGRDYETLMAAVSRAAVSIDFYGKPERVAQMEIPQNVNFLGAVSFDEYSRAVRAADVVAVPTHLMTYPSGQTVALEAAASGAAVILTRTPALEEYFSDDDVCFVEVGDVEGWVAALDNLTQDAATRERLGRAAAKRVHRNFTHEHMWRAFDEVVRGSGILSR